MASPNPIAVAKVRAKTPVGSPLKSADWEKLVSVGLRDRAVFSATVEEMRYLDKVANDVRTAIENRRRILADNASPARTTEGAYQTRERFIQELQQIGREAGLTPEDPELRGGIQDPTSERRLKLIWDMQTRQAQEFAKFKMDQDADVLDAYPAQEFTRIESRKVERDDWQERWERAGGELYDGRMIALKTDPVWAKLSRFGTPWPPFDYGSGMGLIDISRKEAEELGLIEPNEKITPMDADFNQKLEASVSDLSDKMQTALKTIFGDQITIENGVAKWLGSST
jgi:hypothetical protein